MNVTIIGAGNIGRGTGHRLVDTTVVARDPEEMAAGAPAGTRVVKAFNTTFSGTPVARQVAGQPLDVFIAGDDVGVAGHRRRSSGAREAAEGVRAR